VLPNIVPKLMTCCPTRTKGEAPPARRCGRSASVIRNPEIQAIVPVLLEALQDPANTQSGLHMMLNTKVSLSLSSFDHDNFD